MRSLISFGLLYLVACESDKSLVARNPEPVVNIITHQDDSIVLEAMPTMFIGSVTDANHSQDDLTASWYVEGDIPEGCEDLVPDENHEVRCEIQMELNDSNIILVGKDSEGATGRQEINVDVEPTEAPTCEILSPTSTGQYYSDYLIQFEAQVSDAEDAPEDIEVIWSSSIDGELANIDSEPNSTGQVSGSGNLSEGQHSIEIQCTDTSGKQTTESVIIEVGPPNTAPECSISNPAMNSAGPVGGLVSFEGIVSDVDVTPSELTVEWSSDKDGILTTNPSIPDSNGNVLFPFSNLSINTHVISMTVTDEVGAECVANTTFTVGTAPIVSITSPNNGDVINEGESVTFTAEVSDNEDQPNQVALDWTLDGSVFSTQTATSSGTATFSDATLAYGTYNLQVTATDTAGLFETDQVFFQVNALPAAPTISLNPTLPTTTDDLTVSVDVDSIDPENHTITYTYAWERDGVLQTSHTGTTVPSSATSKGEVWTVYVTPNDGYGDGTSVNLDVTVQNTAPTVDTLTLSPNPIDAMSYYVVCNPTTSDVDGDTVTESYAWFVDGVQQTETSDTFLQSWVVGTEITCRVTPNDGDTDGTFMEVSTIVQNTAPVVDSVTLSPSMVYTNDLITATVVLSDVDASQSVTATFDWYVEGSLVQSGTDNTLDGTVHFNRDESVYVEVTANDSVTDGTPLQSSALVVSNTPPIAPIISVSGDLNTPPLYEKDELICSIDVEATDADLDSLVYTYTWTATDGTQIVRNPTTNLSDTLTMQEIFKPGDWDCTVEVSDGTDSDFVSEQNSLMCIGLHFDGVFDYVVVDDDPAFDLGPEGTMEAWVYQVIPASSNTLYMNIFNKWFPGYEDKRFGIRIEQNGFQSNVWVGLQQYIGNQEQTGAGYPIVNILQWNHLSMTWNPSGYTLFINGDIVLQQQNSGVPGNDIGRFFIGHNLDRNQVAGGWRSFQGYIADIRWSDTVKYTTNFTPEPDLQVESDTLFLFKLDEEIGSTVYDASGNAPNGSINGAIWDVIECRE